MWLSPKYIPTSGQYMPVYTRTVAVYTGIFWYIFSGIMTFFNHRLRYIGLARHRALGDNYEG